MLPSRELHVIKSRLSDAFDQQSRDARRLVEMTEDLIQIVRNLVDAAPLICAACPSEQNCGACAVALAKKFLYGESPLVASQLRVTSDTGLTDHVM